VGEPPVAPRYTNLKNAPVGRMDNSVLEFCTAREKHDSPFQKLWPKGYGRGTRRRPPAVRFAFKFPKSNARR